MKIQFLNSYNKPVYNKTDNMCFKNNPKSIFFKTCGIITILGSGILHSQCDSVNIHETEPKTEKEFIKNNSLNKDITKFFSALGINYENINPDKTYRFSVINKNNNKSSHYILQGKDLLFSDTINCNCYDVNLLNYSVSNYDAIIAKKRENNGFSIINTITDSAINLVPLGISDTGHMTYRKEDFINGSYRTDAYLILDKKNHTITKESINGEVSVMSARFEEYTPSDENVNVIVDSTQNEYIYNIKI